MIHIQVLRIWNMKLNMIILMKRKNLNNLRFKKIHISNIKWNMKILTKRKNFLSLIWIKGQRIIKIDFRLNNRLMIKNMFRTKLNKKIVIKERNLNNLK